MSIDFIKKVLIFSIKTFLSIFVCFIFFMLVYMISMKNPLISYISPDEFILRLRSEYLSRIIYYTISSIIYILIQLFVFSQIKMNKFIQIIVTVIYVLLYFRFLFYILDLVENGYPQ